MNMIYNLIYWTLNIFCGSSSTKMKTKRRKMLFFKKQKLLLLLSMVNRKMEKKWINIYDVDMNLRKSIYFHLDSSRYFMRKNKIKEEDDEDDASKHGGCRHACDMVSALFVLPKSGWRMHLYACVLSNQKFKEMAFAGDTIEVNMGLEIIILTRIFSVSHHIWLPQEPTQSAFIQSSVHSHSSPLNIAFYNNELRLGVCLCVCVLACLQLNWIYRSMRIWMGSRQI